MYKSSRIMSDKSRRQSVIPRYNWNTEFVKYAENDATHIMPVAFVALKSCAEADEPKLMAELLGDYKYAHIYALIICCRTIPSIKCIEYLVSVGTPMNETFENNPFQCTVQEYLDNTYNNPTNKMHWKVRSDIYAAILRGNMLRIKK